MKKFVKKLSLGILIATFVFSLVPAFAQASGVTVLTYNGTGIWSWRSVNSFEVSAANARRNHTLHHNQTRNTAHQNVSMEVIIFRSNAIGSARAGSRWFTGNSSGTLTTSLEQGTHFLRFEANQGGANTFNINGSVVRN